jgi:translation elongation factor EF-1beta
MGNALVIFKVFADPESLSAVEAELRKVTAGDFRDLKKEPIGFGIEVIRVGYVIPDKVDGAMEKLETAVKAVKGINEVEVDGITLL